MVQQVSHMSQAGNLSLVPGAHTEEERDSIELSVSYNMPPTLIINEY